MQVIQTDKVKIMILYSSTVEDADKIIVETYGFESTREKIAFLKGMFDIESVGHNELDDMTYFSMLDAITKFDELFF